MKVVTQENCDALKALVAKLMDLGESVEKETALVPYLQLIVCVNQTIGFYGVNREKIDQISDPVDIAFGELIGNLSAYLSRGGFDFDEWRECLEYIMYDCNDDLLAFERNILKLNSAK